MSNKEARDIVDFVIEALVEAGKISERTYGTMTEDFQQHLADRVQANSEE